MAYCIFSVVIDIGISQVYCSDSKVNFCLVSLYPLFPVVVNLQYINKIVLNWTEKCPLKKRVELNLIEVFFCAI